MPATIAADAEMVTPMPDGRLLVAHEGQESPIHPAILCALLHDERLRMQARDALRADLTATAIAVRSPRLVGNPYTE